MSSQSDSCTTSTSDQAGQESNVTQNTNAVDGHESRAAESSTPNERSQDEPISMTILIAATEGEDLKVDESTTTNGQS
jgi:hypothetical protein